jgi:hypothetical protein
MDINWRQTLITCVGIICATIAFGLFVSGCNSCVNLDHQLRMKQLEYRK